MSTENSPTTAVPVSGEATQDEPPAISRARWIGALIVLVLLTEQTVLGYTLLGPALLGLGTKYHTTQVIWIFTVFTLVGGVVIPMLGKLGDRYGKRRILVYAALVAAVGGAVSALAPTFDVLLVGRALQSTSIAFFPLTFALMRDVFPPAYRPISIAIATNGVGVVTVLGPFVAGFLIDHVSVSAVFWFLGAISLVGALGTLALVPESTIRDRSRIDWTGAAGLTLGMLLLLIGISQVEQWTVANPRTVLTVGGGLVVLVLWWFWERRTEQPFIDTRIMANRSVVTVLGAYSLAFASSYLMSAYMPILVQTPRVLGGEYGFGMTATQVAIFQIMPGVTIVLGGVVVGLASKRTGFRIYMIVGPLIMAAGGLAITLSWANSWLLSGAYAIVGIGVLCFAAAPNLMMILSPPAERGITAAMLMTVSSIVASVFAQISGMVLTGQVTKSVQGVPVYSSLGSELPFLIGAGLAAAGFAIALLIPRAERQLTVPAGELAHA
ncbi:MFS transporter [Streptomyces mirabilis]|uniref:MFS transporter n=1 Tax=Streptomyces mirabilis TaxID=68239 RepID=UPI0036D17DD8